MTIRDYTTRTLRPGDEPAWKRVTVHPLSGDAFEADVGDHERDEFARAYAAQGYARASRPVRAVWSGDDLYAEIMDAYDLDRIPDDRFDEVNQAWLDGAEINDVLA